MYKYLASLIAAFAIIFAALPASAAPVVKPILTGPISTDKYAYAYAAEVNRAIRGTPKGATIRVIMFLLDTETVNLLIDAHKRGVRIRVVLDQHQGETTLQTNIEAKRLAKAIGTNRKSNSFLFRPVASGFSKDSNTQMHAKAVTFSQTKVNGRTVKYRSFVGSGNLSLSNTQASWNETQQVDDATIYNGIYRYFNALILDQSNVNQYKKVISGTFTLHFYPGGPNVTLNQLNKITSCKGVTIRVSAFIWTNGRAADARRLRELGAKGCRVQVILNYGTKEQLVGDTISKLLIGAKGVQVRNGRKKDLGYSHMKLTMIETPAWTRVYGGSTNFTVNAMQKNAEITTESSSKATHSSYVDFWSKYWNWSVPMTKAPTAAGNPTDRALETDTAR